MSISIEVGRLKVKDSTSGSKAQNTEWFSTDISQSVKGAASYRIQVSITPSVVIDVTLDSGSTWTHLNSGDVLKDSAIYIFVVSTREGDLFNMRTPTVGGTTVQICRIDESAAES